MKNFWDKYKYIVILNLIMFSALFLVFGHGGNIIIDCGREVAYPQEILNGQILYRDLFNIYGPLAYLFNAVLYKIFGANLSVLFVSGSICSIIIINSVYFIAKKFFDNPLSFMIATLGITTGVLSSNLFNFTFPYSFSMLYGLTAVLVSILFLFKYVENAKLTSVLSASLLVGIAATCKYEFLAFLFLPIILVALIEKGLSKKLLRILGTIFVCAIPALICFCFLFAQGLCTTDLKQTILYIYQMAQSQSLQYFYSTQGVYFDKKLVPIFILNIMKFLLSFSGLMLGFYVAKKTKITATFLIILTLIFITLSTNPNNLVFLPIAVAILGIFQIKSVFQDKAKLLIFLSTIFLSIKVFWALTPVNYGVYPLCIILIAFFALLPSKNKTFVNSGICYLSVLILFSGVSNFRAINDKSFPIILPRGKIYTNKYFEKSTKELVNFLTTNTQKDDTVLILPEGAMINFLSERKTHGYLNSLIPLYVEVFGENKIIELLEKNPPKYIVFNNYNTSDYYFEYICTDYAVSFCNYVAQTYEKVHTINNGFNFLVYKHK